ncbi:MAG: hypothetical protein NC041_09570 [Bacteroides sp.]|nr:hypothetical protein [Prevotella sp.]MCM1408784.1 hypothetical protein [Treponema brennaborense]MCM1470699.1 hypothetical protein [Bacteroides sp.]
MLVIFVQFSNAPSAMRVMPAGIVISPTAFSGFQAYSTPSLVTAPVTSSTAAPSGISLPVR